MVRIFLKEFAAEFAKKADVSAQFHEWMASSGLPGLRRDNVKIAITFTLSLIHI